MFVDGNANDLSSFNFLTEGVISQHYKVRCRCPHDPDQVSFRINETLCLNLSSFLQPPP